MNNQLATAISKVEKAAGVLFDADQSVRSVGIGRAGDSVGYVAVRNVNAPVPFVAKAVAGRAAAAPIIPNSFEGIPINFINSTEDPKSLMRVPHSGPASPAVGSLIREQKRHRPLVCGLQIQNFDNDVRSGEIQQGFIIIGTLGCFVQLAGSQIAILSNNHVVAGENAGITGQDRILQPGAAAFSAAQHAATLTDFVPLKTSPAGANIAAGTVQLNEVDGGVAALEAGMHFHQGYLASRHVKPPRGVAAATLGDKVHKVGRTTGLTFGTITQVGTVVGPIAYAPGNCWFRQTLVIEGDNGSTFSDHGDSGSAIVRDDGMLVGLLFAGNDTQTYACSIDNVLGQLNCRLA